MQHCIGNVLSRNDKFSHFSCIHTKKFIKERNKFAIFNIIICYFLDNVIH